MVSGNCLVVCSVAVFLTALSAMTPPSACADGAILVASGQTDSVLRYDVETGEFLDEFVLSGSGGLEDPRGLAFGPDDNLYVSSFGTGEVLRYDGETGDFIDDFVPSGSGGLERPQDLLFGPDGNLYVASSGDNAVKLYDGDTGEFIDDFVEAGSGGLDRPRGMVFDGDGYLYVASSGDNTVKLYDGDTGEFIDDFVEASSGGLDGPRGVAIGSDGRLYVSSRQTDSVLRYDGDDGAFFDVFASGAGLDGPAGLLFGSNGGLFVSSGLSDQILRFDEDTGDFEEVFEEGDELNNPSFLTEAPETDDVDPPVEKNNSGSTVAEGGTDTITNAELQYVDVGQPPSSVTFTVTSGPDNGQLELTSDPGLSISRFTQSQINDRLVVYVHEAVDTTSDSFDFDVDDGQGNTLEDQTFRITVGDPDEDDDQYCWVTLAVGGSPMEKDLSLLRRFRDKVLMKTGLGRTLVKVYYKTAHPVSTFLAEHEHLRKKIRMLITALVYVMKHPKASILTFLFLLLGFSITRSAIKTARESFFPQAGEPEDSSFHIPRQSSRALLPFRASL